MNQIINLQLYFMKSKHSNNFSWKKKDKIIIKYTLITGCIFLNYKLLYRKQDNISILCLFIIFKYVKTKVEKRNKKYSNNSSFNSILMQYYLSKKSFIYIYFIFYIKSSFILAKSASWNCYSIPKTLKYKMLNSGKNIKCKFLK